MSTHVLTCHTRDDLISPREEPGSLNDTKYTREVDYGGKNEQGKLKEFKFIQWELKHLAALIDCGLLSINFVDVVNMGSLVAKWRIVGCLRLLKEAW